ncbi:helix-turn-helix transcriptional regulator [Bradyrhizobium centrosematis]|uniref:helix-turn-helix transcriptional regulator n=1 Tax=Bradyrhizobium centrosematis TaxID=1300039 RepID=UPI003891138E
MSIIFLRLPAVKERTGLKETTIYKGISEGTFPPSIPLSERCVGWREDQITAWCKAKADGRALIFDRSARSIRRRRS